MVPVTFRAFALPTKSPFFSITKDAASPVSDILGKAPHFQPLFFLITTDFSITWTMFLLCIRKVSLAAGFELWLKSLWRSLSSSSRRIFAEIATSFDAIGLLFVFVFSSALFSVFSSACSLQGIDVRSVHVKTTVK